MLNNILNKVLYGPHINFENLLLDKPVYLFNPATNKSEIAKTIKNKAIVYQWINLINGKFYVGSSMFGQRRIYEYYSIAVLSRNRPIYNSISYYKHENFAFVILWVEQDKISKQSLLEKEQHYLDKAFNLDKSRILNISITAGSNLGHKHTEIFKLARTGYLNPMYRK